MRRFTFFLFLTISLQSLCGLWLPILVDAGQVGKDSLTHHQGPVHWESAFNAETPFDEETLARLEALAEHPINLNEADFSTLLTIPFLDQGKAQAILAYRQKEGAFRQVEALLTTGILNTAEYRLLSPFFTIARVTSQKQLSERSLTLVQAAGRKIDLEPAFHRSVDTGGYVGSPVQLYTRFALSTKRTELRVAFEKDAGEAFQWQPGKQVLGFDHLSGTFTWKTTRLIREVLLGDFHVLAGEGLMLWRNTGQGKGTQPLSDPVRTGTGIKPGASREENKFLRGIALTVQPLSGLVTRLFASHRQLDASLEESTATKQTYVTALGTSGLHRTRSEQSRKDLLGESLAGGSMVLEQERLTIGITGYLSRFDYKFSPGTRPEDLYDFSGQKLAGLSLHARINRPTVRVFGEFSRSFPGAYAMLAGIRWTPDTRTSMLGVARVFSPQYHTLHGQAFADQRSKVQNEAGWYMALETRVHPHWTASAYVDFYRHPWVTSKTGLPRNGFSAFSKLAYAPRPWFYAHLFYRFESDQETAPGFAVAGLPIQPAVDASVHILRCQILYVFSRMLHIRMQLDRRVSQVSGIKKAGSMLIQDVIWRPGSTWRIQLRLSGFTSPGGLATLYAYENDLRYRFTIRAFSGTGSRNFLLLRKRVGTHLTFEAKYGTTLNRQISNTQAGAYIIPGKRIREVQAQFIWHV